MSCFSRLREVSNVLQASQQRQRIASHELGHAEPLPLDVEVVLFQPHLPSTREEMLCYPDEPLSQHPTDQDRLLIIREQLLQEKIKKAMALSANPKPNMNGDIG